jgi:hypothetical protein
MMLGWLTKLLGLKPYRVAQPWETPAGVRKKLRCAIAGIDPAFVAEPQPAKEGKSAALPPTPERACQRGSP